ncbi:MAG: hypothetical protein HQK96_04205 [Nitrospirae bacterium]|nr:hypothetical protein [Nitrospirota bacterium]
MNASIEKWTYACLHAGNHLNKGRVVDGVKRLYSFLGCQEPEIIFTESPLSLYRIVKSLKKNKERILKLNMFNILKSQYRDGILVNFGMIYGTREEYRLISQFQHMIRLQIMDIEKTADAYSLFAKVSTDYSLITSAPWFFYYDYLDIKAEYRNELFAGYRDFLDAGPFMCKFLRHHAIVCARPEHVTLNNRQQLHCDGGAVARWRDGFEIYSLNGVAVPRELAVIHHSDIDAKLILSARNADVRREIVRKVGIERIIKEFNAKVIDRWQGYELLEFVLPEIKLRALYLKMVNPSIGTYHVEGVPPSVRTCKEALNWRIGGLEWEPEQLT